MHSAWPVLGWNLPPGHTSHWVAPADEEYFPAPHGTHSCACGLHPTITWPFLPVQAWSSFERWYPAGHVLHVTEPTAGWNCPLLQTLQWWSWEGSPFWNLPAAQGVQLVPNSTWDMPAAQGAQLVRA